VSGRALAALARRVVACERCPRLVAHRRRIARVKRRAFADQSYWGRPVPGWGDPAARLLVVGLAPAAHGANRTGRMFTGDSSGAWLYAALHRFGFASRASSTHRADGLRLRDCWITAAARCAPRQLTVADQARRCRPYLETERRLLPRVRVVLVLGRIAHDAYLRAAGWWERLAPRERPRFAHAAVARLPDGTLLVSSFHPSRQNTNTRKLTRAMWHGVFRTVQRLLREARAAPAPAAPAPAPPDS
jgi:uracil-DNA glycosylase family 4